MIQKKQFKNRIMTASAVIMALIFTMSVGAQQGRRMVPNNPRGFQSAPMTITGTVTNIQPAESCWRYGGNGLLATIQSGENTYHVHLGPEAYLQQKNIAVKKNSKITVTARPGYWNRTGQHIALSVMTKDGEIMLRPMGRGNRGWGQANRGWRQTGRGWGKGRNRRY